MNPKMTNPDLIAAAKEHADNLARDITNASTRIEHLRLTQHALEAERLVELASNCCGESCGCK